MLGELVHKYKAEHYQIDASLNQGIVWSFLRIEPDGRKRSWPAWSGIAESTISEILDGETKIEFVRG